MPLNFDPNDPQVAQRLITGLPPVLPSLAKPQSEIAGVTPSSFPGVRPVADENAQRQFTGGLALKPQLSALTMTPAVTNPSAGLPPVTTPTPSPEERRVAGVQAKLEKLQQTPSATAGLWQKAGEYHVEHPGIIGRLGQVGAGILRGVDIAGETLMPNVARQIPGSGLNRSQNIAQTQTQLGEAEKEAGQAAERSYRSAEADKAGADAAKARRETELLGQPKPTEEKWEGVNDAGGGPVLNAEGQPLEREQVSGKYRWNTDVSGVKKAAKSPTETSVQHKMDMEAIGATAGVTGNPKTERTEINAARQAGKITDQQARDYLAFRNVEGTQGSRIDVTVAGQQSAEAIRRSDKLYAYEDDEGKTQWAFGNKIPKGANVMYELKNPELAVKGARNMNIVQNSFGKLASHKPEMFDDPATRSIITTSLDENKARSMGILVAGTGGSLTMPSGAGKIIDQLLQNNAVPQKYRQDTKDFIVDYYSMKDKMLALQQNLQGGKIGRLNAPALEAMFNQLPGVNTADSSMFRRQVANLKSFIDDAREDIPDEYGTFKKTSGEGGGGEAPEGTRIQVGDKVQVKRGGKWVNE
jgi:hypothetical protein